MSEYKMVPVEPSLEMISAMIEADWKRPQSILRGSSNYLASMYQAAVSSVPAVEDKSVAELEAELAEAMDILRQWGNMFEGGGICGTLKILRDANNAFLARNGDKS